MARTLAGKGQLKILRLRIFNSTTRNQLWIHFVQAGSVVPRNSRVCADTAGITPPRGLTTSPRPTRLKLVATWFERFFPCFACC